ncbi:MAG: hypothetical protein RXR20_32565, partial [Paraburkholderia sp.]
MQAKKSLKSFCFVAPVFVLGALLGGCNDGDHLTPDLDDVKAALHERYGECPLWTLSGVRRIDGAPNQNGYEISYSFVLTLKDIGTLSQPGASGELAKRARASLLGNDPCSYGAALLAEEVLREQQPVTRSYQGSGDRVFVHSERGWHLVTSPTDPLNPATYDPLAPLDDATAAAMQTGSADADSDSSGGNDGSAGQRSIFHRLNLMVMSLFRTGSHSGESVNNGSPAAAAATSASSEAPAPGSEVEQAASSAAATDATSAPAALMSSDTPAASAPVVSVSPAPVPPAATSSVAPTVNTGTPSPAQGTASADQDTPAPPLAASAVEPPAARSPVAHPLAAADLEGDWQGTYQCGPYIGAGSVSDPDAWTQHVAMTVRDGQVTLVRESEGDRAFREVLSGNVLPDLSLHLGGTGQHITAKHPWNADFMGRFNGTADQATFEASGTLS